MTIGKTHPGLHIFESKAGCEIYLLRRDHDKIRYKQTQEDFEQQKLILYLQILQTHLQGHFFDFSKQGVTVN